MRKYCFVMAVAAMTACGGPGIRTARSPEATTISDTSRKASCVYLAEDERHDPVISWCESDPQGKKYFRMAFFNPNTGSFGDPVNVPIEQNAELHEEGMPKLAFAADGSCLAVYEVAAPTALNEWAGALRYIRSADRGGHWSAARYVHADTTGGRSRSFAGVARLGDGSIGVAWLDQSLYPSGGRPVRFAKTGPEGKFVGEQMIDSTACECCRVAIAAGPGTQVAIVYRDLIGDSIRDMSVARSADNGASFGQPVSFSDDGWVVRGCPHNGPSVVSEATGISTAWRTGSAPEGVYYGELNSRGLVKKKYISADGRNIQLCRAEGETVAVYSDLIADSGAAFGRIIVDRMDGDSIRETAVTGPREQAGYPVVLPAGKGRLVIAWTDSRRIVYRVMDMDSISRAVVKPSRAARAAAVNISVLALAIKNDPSCGMPLGVIVHDTIHDQGKIFGFCSPACRQAFAEAHHLPLQ